MIRITQYDTAVLTITCKNGRGGYFDLTGASIVTKIPGANGSVISLSNSKHTIISASGGRFTLALAASDTAAFAIGKHEVVTTVTQGANVTSFHGRGLCEVLSTNPV